MSKILIASDPEVFLKSKNGHHVPATELIGGDKQHPRETKHGWVQEDGAAAEFNVHPAQTEEEFIRNHLAVLSDLEEIVKVHELEIDISPSVIFNEDDLWHPSLFIAGCSPDYDAWTDNENIPPAYQSGLRAAGGHVHISFDAEDKLDRIRMVQALDLVLGIPSVILDSDIRRRTLYGKAGAYRPKYTRFNDAYDGIEYRTLSNFWLKSEDLMAWVFNGVHKAYSLKDRINFDELGNEIIPIINHGLIDEAKAFCVKHNIGYP